MQSITVEFQSIDLSILRSVFGPFRRQPTSTRGTMCAHQRRSVTLLLCNPLGDSGPVRPIRGGSGRKHPAIGKGQFDGRNEQCRPTRGPATRLLRGGVPEKNIQDTSNHKRVSQREGQIHRRPVFIQRSEQIRPRVPFGWRSRSAFSIKGIYRSARSKIVENKTL